MAWQSSVNIFDINNKKKNQNEYDITSWQVNSSFNNGGVNPNSYTREMEKLDRELEAEGLKIERLSEEEKTNYVNSLTDAEYERLTQYRDAWYSFGSAKALVDLERERNYGVTRWYRAEWFQLGEPLGGAESLRNRSNFIGRVTELLDDRVQNTLVPAMTVDQKEQRTQKLVDRYNKMTEEEWNKLYNQYMADVKSWKAKQFVDDTLQENLDYYWKNQNMSFWDKFWWADIKTAQDESWNKVAEANNYPSMTQMFANVPGSALSNASAVIRWATNPVDTLAMLVRLIGTKEGRDILAYRYLDQEGRNESIEKDPVGWLLDLFDFWSLGLNISGKAVRWVSMAERLAGATKTAEKTSRFADNLANASRSLENVADMGISEAYSKLLDKQLGKLSEGGKAKNVLGDYISMTQRPLQTIWNGANPKDEKWNQPYQNGAWTYEWLQKPFNKVMEGIKENIQNQATGLTPEVRERIRQNPYIKEYRERIETMLQDEWAPMDNQKILEEPIEEVGNELLRRLEEYESRLQEDGAEYQVLDKVTRPYNISAFMTKVYDVFNKNGISLTPDGELYFRTTANPADMNPVSVAWNLIRAMEPNVQDMTIKQIREFRQQLRSLIKYHSDAPSTKYSKKVLRELIDWAFNSVVHKEIPSLAKVDEIYSKRLDELKQFKDGLIYQVWEKKGQIKDNFYSIISTLNTQNRQKMKARVEKLFPDLGARVEAIRMLPTLVKTYQNSPKLVNNMLKTLTALTWVKYSQWPVQLAVSWILWIIADELISKPLGEKWRKREISELLSEMSPEAKQKLADIKSKVDAGVELSEQEKADLQTAMQEIAIKEYEYLDEQHQKEFDKILKSANNEQPKLPGTMDTIGPDGTIKLSAGKQVNNPEEYNLSPRNRNENISRFQDELGVDQETAEGVTNTIDDFLDEIGANIEWEINPREVNYEKFNTRSLEKLMDDPDIPQSEKNKIADILVKRWADVDERSNLDQEFAYRIYQLGQKEQRVGKVGKNKVDRSIAKEQQNKLEKERDALKVEMRERYAWQWVDLDQTRGDEKYAELEWKWIDYINNYKKSKQFRDQKAEEQVLNQLKNDRKKQPKFIRDMDDNMASKRDQIVNNKLQNGYERETTDVWDRFINKQTWDKWVVKYNNNKVEVIFTEDWFRDSWVLEIIPGDAEIRFTWEPDTIKASEIRWDDYEYQTVGRANPNEKTITAEEWLNLKSFKGDKTIGELADEYWLKKQIVEKIFTAEGEEALGRARGDLIELVKEIKEGTAPHEVFHPIFNMINSKRRAEIIDLVRRHKGITEKEAKERLADSFSEYFRTGKFDTKPIPEGFVNKVKRFFNKVKEFINGTWRSRKKIQKLFDDIMEGKISVEKPQWGIWEYQIEQKSLFDQEPKETKLEAYFKEKPYNIDIMYKTYDPDVVEWMNNIKKKFVGGEDITMNELYEVKNMIDEHLASNWIYIDKSVPDQPTAQLLMESAQMWKSKKIWTYDRKQIEKIWFETNQLIENRIKDIKMYYENINPDWEWFDDEWRKEAIERKELLEDEFHDFEPDYIYAIGKTYDPDIDKWHNNIKEWLKDNLKKYEWFVWVSAKQIGDIILPHQLNSLKSKINELWKYSYEDIFKAFEWQEAELLFRAVKPRIEELKAKWVENAVTNLVAVSNMDVDKFIKQMEEPFGGKSPMPSIAVMDVNVPHEVFGDLTLVFGRDTIDPKVDPANKIYGSDAWTPTFPDVKEVGWVSYNEIKKFVGDKIDNMIDRWLDIDPSEAWYLWNDITRLISEYSDRPNVQGDAGMYAEQIIDDLYGWWYENFIKNNEEAVEELKEDIWTFLENIPNDRRQVIPASYFEFDTAKKEENIRRISEDVAEYLKNDPNADYIWWFYDEWPEWERKLLEDITRFVEDRWDDWTETIIDKLVMEYGADEDVLRDIVEKYYLPEWDRPLTPENVLEAMRNQRTRRETYPGSYEDMIEIEWTELNDVEDVRRQNFAKVFHWDWTGDLGDLKDRYNKLIDIIRDEYIVFDSEIPDMDTPDPQVIRALIKDEYNPDIDEFMANLEENPLLSEIPRDVAQRIIDVVEQGKKIPIRFSESKPERIVDLTKEVEYILVPEGKDTTQVENAVKWTPLEWKVVPYKPDDYSAPRSRKMKELQKKYGNVFFSMWWVKMPIAMLYLMMEWGDDQEEGQQA